MADQVRDAIRNCGMSVSEISDKSGVTQGQIYRFLKNERDMGFAAIEKIMPIVGLEIRPSETKPKGKMASKEAKP